MKFVKLLTVPAVLLTSLAFAVPASAHALTNATVAVNCQTQTGKVCVTLSGSIEAGNDERKVVFDLFDQADLKKSLGEITFDLPANHGRNAIDLPSTTLCFEAVTAKVTSFVVQVVKVTDANGQPSDLSIHITGGANPIAFTPTHQVAVPIGETGECAPPASPPPTTTGSGSGSGTTGSGAGQQTSATTPLAQTGGFDFRFPLIGLVILVAGAVLYFVSVSRGRSASQR